VKLFQMRERDLVERSFTSFAGADEKSLIFVNTS
jgi:hypothetical protein